MSIKRKRATKALVPLIRMAAAKQRMDREWNADLAAYRLQIGLRP